MFHYISYFLNISIIDAFNHYHRYYGQLNGYVDSLGYKVTLLSQFLCSKDFLEGISEINLLFFLKLISDINLHISGSTELFLQLRGHMVIQLIKGKIKIDANLKKAQLPWFKVLWYLEYKNPYIMYKFSKLFEFS